MEMHSNRSRYNYWGKGYQPECSCGWTYDAVFNASRVAVKAWTAHAYDQPIPEEVVRLGWSCEARRKYVFESRMAEEQEESDRVRREALRILTVFTK